MEICIVEFPVDFPCLNLAECDLLFDIVDHHHEVFALLGVRGVIVDHSDDGWKLEWYVEFLTESNDEVDVFGKGEDCASFGVSGGCGDGSLFDTSVVERSYIFVNLFLRNRRPLAVVVPILLYYISIFSPLLFFFIYFVSKTQ